MGFKDERAKYEAKMQVRGVVHALRILDVGKSEAELENMMWGDETGHSTVVDFEDLDPAVGESTVTNNISGISKYLHVCTRLVARVVGTLWPLSVYEASPHRQTLLPEYRTRFTRSNQHWCT